MQTVLPVGSDQGWSPQQAEAERRQFAERHKRMGWFYQLLDVAYGMELAADDVARHRRHPAAVAALIVSAWLAFVFVAIWVRYDLISTWTTLAPLGQRLSDGMVGLFPEANRADPFIVFLSSALSLLLQLGVTLGPTLIQVGMPYMAGRHAAAWLALWGSAVFDMATDSIDIRNDTTVFFGWLIEMATAANSWVWWSLIGLGLLLCLIRNEQWPLWVGLIAVAAACLFWGQAGNVVYWGNVVFWTMFASFAAQSLAFVFVGKTIMLAVKARDLRYAS
jgi:hypothetical protein